MENIKEELEEMQMKLNEKHDELETLESEKSDIITRYDEANDEEKFSIEKEMEISEQKYKNLLAEIAIFNEELIILQNKEFE